MAKKELPNKSSKFTKASKSASDQNIPLLLNNALQALRTGTYKTVVSLLSKTLRTINNPAQLKIAQEILAEAYFRAAISSTNNEIRLNYLQEALKLTPEAARLHFCLALTLWQADRVAEASAELKITATHEPHRQGLAYFRGLMALAQGQKLVTTNLSQPELNTLQIVESLIHNTSIKATGTDKLVLGKSLPFWSLLTEMQLDAQAAPWQKLQELADKGGYKKAISTILNYYKGVAAQRAGKDKVAQTAWLKAQSAGFNQPWLADNLSHNFYELIKQENWDELLSQLCILPIKIVDPTLKEVVGLAYYHLGYQAAQNGDWETAVRYWYKASENNSSCRLSQNLALAEEALENWADAATSWREMVRQRSRKATNPNYLNNDQVAAVWRRAAECYNKAEETAEAITCLKNALKYAENNLELRVEIADALLENGQEQAAKNELNRIITIAPDNVEALMRLGSLALTTFGNNEESISIWKKVLKIDPKRTEAKEALATTYLNQLGYFFDPSLPNRIKFIKDALEELPDHPKLLLALGKLNESHNPTEAVEIYRRAYQVAAKDLQLVSQILHELLHVNIPASGVVFEEIYKQVRQFPGLAQGFWFHQGQQALHCNLGAEPAMQFFDEAVVLGVETKQSTKAKAFLDIFLLIYGQRIPEKELKALDNYYLGRIEAEAPKSGVKEYIQGYKAFKDRDNIKEARRLLKEAKKKAQQANEPTIIEAIERVEAGFNRPKGRGIGVNGVPLDVLMRMMEMFPKGAPTMKDLKKLPPEEVEMLMKMMGALAGESFEDFDY